MYSRRFEDIEKMITEMCEQWFEEYKLIPKEEIRDIMNEYKHELSLLQNLQF